MFTIKISYDPFTHTPKKIHYRTAKAAIEALTAAIKGNVSGAFIHHKGKKYSACEARKEFKVPCLGLDDAYHQGSCPCGLKN